MKLGHFDKQSYRTRKTKVKIKEKYSAFSPEKIRLEMRNETIDARNQGIFSQT